MPQSVLLPTPIREIRQYADAPFVDMVFDLTSDRVTYLTSPRRYGGMVVTDKQEQRMYFLNTATDTWIPVAPGGFVKGLGSKEFSITLDGTTGKGEVGALTIDNIDIPIGAFIAGAYIDVGSGLTADDDSSYITVGIESDDEVSALDTPLGLVLNLNANAAANTVTQILTPSLKRATDNRVLVAAVGGANITAGVLTVIVILSNQLVDAGGGGGGSQSWQQTLDISSILNKNNSIDGGGFELDITNCKIIDIQSVNVDNSFANIQLNTNTADEPFINFIVQNSDSSLTTILKLDKDSASINRDNVGAKNIITSINNTILADAAGNANVSGVVAVESVIDGSGGSWVDNTDPLNPIINPQAENGVTIGGFGLIWLGGTLTHDTTIDLADTDLRFETASTGGKSVHITNTGVGSALILSSADTAANPLSATLLVQNNGVGDAIAASSVNGGTPLVLGAIGSTSTVTPFITMNNNNSGAGSAGIGGSLDMSTVIAGGATVNFRMIYKVLDATSPGLAELSFIVGDRFNNLTMLTIDSLGAISFPRGLRNFANDAAAAVGTPIIPVGGLYRNASGVQIRVT